MAEAALAAKAVGWVVSPLITKLSNTYLGGDASAEKLRVLKTITLPKIEKVIEAAETNPNAIVGLEPWLNDLRAAALEAEDVLDELDYKLLKEKVKKKKNKEDEDDDDQVSSLSFAWARSVSESCKKIPSKAKEFLSPVLPKTELAKSVEKLEKVASRVGEFMKLLKLQTNPNLAGSSSTSAIAKTQEVITTTSNPPLAVFGRDKQCDSIVNLLTTSVAIYGIGGAGKTTLAQKIYHDSKVVDCFPDCRMWVHVPRKFDTSRVAKEMMESLTGGATGDMLNLNALLAKLKANLKDKKFLLVLDDVWDEPKDGIQYRWDQLVGALNAVAVRGSRILMTTRSEGVASMLGAKDRIRLEELASEDCLSIIEHYAFKDGLKFADFPGELREVGIQIVNRLKGSPLAARMVASNQLRQNSTVDAWRSISEGDLLKKTTVRDVLLSSFKHLPVHLQRCFAFCSLFPEGEYMYHDELVNLWIAEGFVDAQEKNGSRAEDIGSRYCDELEYHSFFQRPPDSSESDICYVIHDLLHDLAGDVSNGICYRIEGDDEPREIPLTVVHLSITDANLGIHLPNICKLVSLRTLILMGDSETEFADFVEVFEKLKRLRVLDPGYASGFSELPSFVGHLKHLRHLRLEYTGIKRLPESFSRLYHLQLLNLENSSIESLPEGMNNLISLRQLIADRDLVCSIPEIGKLTSLQTLEEYRIGKDKLHGIGQLKTMRELRGSLRIKNLENVRDRAEASKAMLKEKKHLDKLTLEWADSDDRDGKSDEEVLEGLEPYPPTLKKLKICGYKGVGTPSWMSESQHLCHLEELYLSDCSKWEVLPPLGQLPMLRVLDIKNATGVRQIGPEFYGMDGGNSGGFPRLKELNLSGMEICEQWTGGSAAAFPSLPFLHIVDWPELRHVSGLPVKRIWITSCPKLKQLSCLPHKLTQLDIRECPELTEISLSPLLSPEELKIEECPPAGIASLRCSIPMPTVTTAEVASDSDVKQVSFRCPQSLSESKKIDGWRGDHHLMTALKCVYIEECGDLRSIEGLEALPSLEELSIGHCSRLLMTMSEAAADPPQPLLPSSLRELSIRNCDGVDRLPPGFLLGLTSLTNLSISNCAHIRSLGDDLSHPTSLQRLTVTRCQGLARRAHDGRFPSVKEMTAFTPEQEEEEMQSLSNNLERLSSLKQLGIWDCPMIETLPNHLPATLGRLYVHGCHPELKRQYEEGGPQRHKIQHIRKISIGD